jgi:hypothetical protein
MLCMNVDGQLRIGASVTRTHYTLGRQFAALDANGNATISTLYALHPLIRSLVSGLDTQDTQFGCTAQAALPLHIRLKGSAKLPTSRCTVVGL